MSHTKELFVLLEPSW